MPVTSISPARLSELGRTGAITHIDVRTPAKLEVIHVAFARKEPLERLNFLVSAWILLHR
jgi:hypothetical protein